MSTWYASWPNTKLLASVGSTLRSRGYGLACKEDSVRMPFDWQLGQQGFRAFDSFKLYQFGCDDQEFELDWGIELLFCILCIDVYCHI